MQPQGSCHYRKHFTEGLHSSASFKVWLVEINRHKILMHGLIKCGYTSCIFYISSEIFFILFVFVVFGGKGFVLDLKIQDKFYCVACKDEGQIFSAQSD